MEQRLLQNQKDYRPVIHPVVRQHPRTGALAIFVNRGFTDRINGVSEQENEDLLAALHRMAERPEYQARMRWKDAGDVLVYDNRNTNHYAVTDYHNLGARTLHHIALLGEPTKDAEGKVVDGNGDWKTPGSNVVA